MSSSAPPSDRVSTTATKIEADWQNGDRSSAKLLGEVNTLRQDDTQNGKLNKTTYNSDLSQLSSTLHQANVLPSLDIVDSGSSDAGLRGTGTAGKTPDGSDSLITKSHGTTFTYNKDGQVQSWTKGDTSWKYNSTDGDFHEYKNGKETSSKVNEAVSMSGNGTETINHPDGSTTTVASWGGTIDRNASGQMTQEVRGKDSKTFKYDGTTLESMTDTQNGKSPVTYTRANDGSYYASNDTDKKNPLSIQVEPQDSQNGKVENGVVQIKNNNSGDYTNYRWGGTDTNYNKNNELTSIDYNNGNKASDFTYSSSNSGQVSGFKITDKDGKTHTYKDHNGQVSMDGGTAAAGQITVGDQGAITVSQTPADGGDSGFKQVQFGLGGDQVTSAKINNQIVPESINNGNGHVSTFKYNSSGDLTAVNAYGYDLQLKNNAWVNASNGDAVKFTPSVSQSGSFGITNADGSFTSWSPNGVQTSGILDTSAVGGDTPPATTTSGTSTSTGTSGTGTPAGG